VHNDVILIAGKLGEFIRILLTARVTNTVLQSHRSWNCKPVV